MRVFRLARDRVIAGLRAASEQLVAARSDVVEVWLFGSMARGEGRPGSDADLLVVLRDGAPAFLDRIEALARHFGGVGIGCDVLAYTESECRLLRQQGNPLLRKALGEGMLLARR